MAETAVSLLLRAWELSYLDPQASRELALGLCSPAGKHAAEAQQVVALAEVRLSSVAQARQSLDTARALALAEPDPDTRQRGLHLCDELLAMLLRRQGDVQGAAHLQARLDAAAPARATADGRRAAMHRFLALNSRAVTAKLLGEADVSLRHLHGAWHAAQQTGWQGPYVTACANLGGRHHELYNLEEARTYSLHALKAATEAGAKLARQVAACNLIGIHYALGEWAEAQALGSTLETLLQGEAAAVRDDMTPPLALACMAGGEFGRAEALMRSVQHMAVHEPAGEWALAWGWQMARCRLAQGDADGAHQAAHGVLQASVASGGATPSYDLMMLQRALCDAAEQTGKPALALHHLREAHTLYEHLAGRSARARYVSLDITHQLEQARHERDVAVDGRRSVEDDRRRLIELNSALQAQMAETERLHQQLREQALHDPLTGLHNRRYLFEMAPGLLELARRQGEPLCVVLLDLDHFKLLNDTCGHAAGDLVLQRFGQLLRETLRKSDVLCRHGGEEFVAVMPGVQGDEAAAVISRLLELFTSLQLALGRRRLPRGSFSAGIALFPNHGTTLEQLLSRADRALYAAKNQGRSRIEQVPRTGFATLE